MSAVMNRPIYLEFFSEEAAAMSKIILNKSGISNTVTIANGRFCVQTRPVTPEERTKFWKQQRGE